MASILIEMDSCNTPTVITDCVLNHLLSSVEQTAQQVIIKFILSAKYILLYSISLQSFELKSLVEELLKSKNVSIRLLSIINVSLLKIYSQSKPTISDLQEWNLWPKIFSGFGTYLCY